jgi:hypothetical protein
MAERYNSAGAWYNHDKKSEKHPSYSGSANVEGVLYFVDVWVKDRGNGEKFLSMSFKLKEKQENAAQLDPSDDVPV